MGQKMYNIFLQRVEGQSFKTLEKIKREFNLENGDMFRYFQLQIKKGICIDGNEMMGVLTGSYKQTPSKKNSKLWGLQKNGRCALYVKTKWELELNTVRSVSDWLSILKTQHTSTSSKRWSAFRWKNVICFFITPHIKDRQLDKEQHCWRQCGQLNANHSHVFWYCVKVQTFWISVITILEEILCMDVRYGLCTWV